MTYPEVSVVVGVYNAARYLKPSLRSVLSQQGVAFELILVDDGSNDGSSEILEEFQTDGRVRLIRQPNAGLTQALIRGCELARGEFIARHDTDDRSCPGRFAAQVAALRSDARLAFVSGGVRSIGPEEETLFESNPITDPVEATRQLQEEGIGPVHGSVMMRRSEMRAVGGYRGEFRLAQDVDLWLRLAEQGLLGHVERPVYEFRVHGNALSSRNGSRQQRLGELARRCAEKRRLGESERAALAAAKAVSSQQSAQGRESSGSDYFVGRCLMRRRDRRARTYLRRSVTERPWHIRRWAALAACYLTPFQNRGVEP